VRRWVRENSLALFFLGIFLAALIGQALVGHSDFNNQQLAHQDPTMSLGRYVTSSAFMVDVMENWQSEYLQFTLYILLTVWFVQKGSPESKKPEEIGTESDKAQQIGAHAGAHSPRWARVGGLRTRIYSNSLLIVMLTIWALSWLGQGVAGRVDYNAEQIDHRQAPIGLARYLTTSDFWNRTLQNWQSEFLAVGSMAIFAVYLRQRGSPESKPVGAAHDATGVEG
jgi:hypothetical protein